MKIIKLPFLLVLFACCKSQSYKVYLKAREDRDKQMEFIKKFPDPFEYKLADSMKIWIPIFKNVYTSDQKHRLIGYGFTKEGLKEQIVLDSLNLIVVTSFLDKYGWPATFDVGFFGQRAVSLTIQHSPLKIQEKYYPALVKAFKRDSLLYESLALLEDRINARNKRLQYYGTHFITYKGKQVLFPVFEVDSLEIRRKRIGFKSPMKDFMKQLKTVWNINEYKQIQPDLIREFKVSDTLGVHFKF